MEWSTTAILDDVSRATSDLIMEEPFFGHFFVGILKEVHEGIQTMAIGPSGHHVKLHINPIFWKTQLTNRFLRMGLVKHEILHVVFKHIFRGKDYANKSLFNIACDLVVNQYITVDWLPPNRIHLGLFPGIGLLPERDADEYYRLLSRFKEKCDQLGEDESESGLTPEQQKSWDNLKGMLDAADEWQERHGAWTDIADLPAPLRELLEDQVNAAISQSLEKSRRDSREWGKLPGSLRAYLKAHAQARLPVVNWRRLLRIFSESSRQSYVRNTLRRPSKRYGTTPGIKVRKHHKLLVAIDTSMSINAEDIAEFFSEIHHIWKRGSEVMIVECDTKIAATYAYRGEVPNAVHGRGGTQFDEPIRWANAQYRPDAIVYFTDGFGPLPEVASRAPILWMLSRAGCTAGPDHMANFPGMKVRMHPHITQEADD